MGHMSNMTCDHSGFFGKKNAVGSLFQPQRQPLLSQFYSAASVEICRSKAIKAGGSGRRLLRAARLCLSCCLLACLLACLLDAQMDCGACGWVEWGYFNGMCFEHGVAKLFLHKQRCVRNAFLRNNGCAGSDGHSPQNLTGRSACIVNTI